MSRLSGEQIGIDLARVAAHAGQDASRWEFVGAALVARDLADLPLADEHMVRHAACACERLLAGWELALADAMVAHAAIGDREGDALVRGAIAAVEEQMLPHRILVRLQEAVLTPPGMTRHRWRIAAITQSLLAVAA